MKRIHASLVTAGLASVLAALYLTTATATPVAGTATVTGTVDAPKSFKAAQVYFRNRSKRMLYMVYTVGGRFQAMNLLPGDYEVSVKTKGLQNLESGVTNVSLTAGQRATVNLSMHDAVVNPKTDVQYLSFDQIYPQGPGQEFVKKTCVNCHGQNFIPLHHWNEQEWNAALDLMTGAGRKIDRGVMIQPEDMKPGDREAAVKYLTSISDPTARPER